MRLLLFTFLLTGCEALLNFTANTDNQFITIDGGEGIIFSAAFANSQDITPYWADEISGYWTPDEATIYQMEQQLPEFLRQQDYEGLSQAYGDYFRQYVGYTSESGQFIYGNYFCEDFDDWRTNFINVLDGGECFFETQYDVRAEQFVFLYVHGHA